MSIQSMAGIIDQIHFQAAKISGLNKSDRSEGVGASNVSPFSDLLFNSINSLNQAQNQAKEQSQAFMSGASDIGLNDVMLSLQKSAITLNLGIQVRNKLVSAYQDIMSMSL
ncbi:flagellar hook-basal body complex protein FliE [Pantoea anthophila]|uniref:flagellar hook-basal body complex protein FliE n=1 Tax=Pantoea anthophila TaxID=470931 RepID=UPI00277F4697|nr:flagellar hook-basal body complex protein FliE [Pantoea anthophila]MDQ1213509.1 flagellar hook-basal body complex protein FliE [Pantoea anthophila]